MRSTLVVLLLTVTVAFFVPKTYAAGPCPGDPDCPTPSPTPRVCDDLNWYCLRECASSETRQVFGGNATLWRQQKIEFTNRDNGTNYTSCTQAGPITPTISPSPTRAASPTPSTQVIITPTPADSHYVCSPNGWRVTFAWEKPNGITADAYSLFLDHPGPWFTNDGADVSEEIDNATEATLDIIPRQAYTVEIFTRPASQGAESIPVLGKRFNCIPQQRTTSTAPCFTNNQKNAQCTVDLWAKDMNESNSGNLANEILAPSTDADLNTVLDLLDFEHIRAATHD